MSRYRYSHEEHDPRDDGRYDEPRDYEPRRRGWHWCDVCHGHTGPDSPCYVPTAEELAAEAEEQEAVQKSAHHDEDDEVEVLDEGNELPGLYSPERSAYTKWSRSGR